MSFTSLAGFDRMNCNQMWIEITQNYSGSQIVTAIDSNSQQFFVKKNVQTFKKVLYMSEGFQMN